MTIFSRLSVSDLASANWAWDAKRLTDKKTLKMATVFALTQGGPPGRFVYASPDKHPAIWDPPGVDSGGFGGFPGVPQRVSGGVLSVVCLNVLPRTDIWGPPGVDSDGFGGFPGVLQRGSGGSLVLLDLFHEP